MGGRADHYWVDASGLPWTVIAMSDACHQCGRTPDAHPEQFVLTGDQISLILDRISHRLDWLDEGYTPSDFKVMVLALADHASATRPKEKGRRR